MEAKLYNPLQVVANALNVHVEYVPGFLGEEGNQHQKHPEGEADLTQATDSNFQTADHRGCGTCSDAPNDDNLIGDFDFNCVEKAVKAGVHLDNTDPQTGTNAKHCTYHRKDVYCISHPTIDLVANEGIKTSAHGHGKAFPVTHKGKEQTNNNVHDPAVNTPVEQGHIHGVLSELIVTISVKKRALDECMTSYGMFLESTRKINY